MVALLLESDLIKKRQPPYNRGQRHTRYSHSIVSAIDKKGYIRLELLSRRTEREVILSFSNKYDANAFLSNIINRFRLCQKLCNVHKGREACFNYHLKMCLGACIEKEPPESYNKRVMQAIQQFDYSYPNFMVIGRGRHETEHSVVAVEKGVYQGFGYFEHSSGNISAYCRRNIRFLRERIEPKTDNQEVRRIIRGYLKQGSEDVIVKY